jgi:tetratricopeptide (TPR) repeat protein
MNTKQFSALSRLVAYVMLPAFASLAGVSLAHANPDAIREAQVLYESGKLAQALDKVQGVLKVTAKDPQAMFLRGLIHTEQGKNNEAIRDFMQLTEDRPELPEPYNNLAVLHASMQNWDKAKAALELAIQTHPTYATAHENLGDVYAQLASRAYDQALSLDRSNSGAKVKLSMIKELVGHKSGQPPKARDDVKVAQLNAPKNNPAPPVIGAAKGSDRAPDVIAPAAKAAPVAAPTGLGLPAASAPAPAPVASSGTVNAEVNSAIQAWATAWSSKNLDSYFAAYTPDFAPSGKSNTSWAAERRERITRAKSISVVAKVQSIDIKPEEVVAVIRQSYKSDTLTSENTKTLKFINLGGRWLIKYELAN